MYFFGHAEKRFDKKAKNNVKIYDVINWETNNYNTHIPNIVRSKRNQTVTFGQLIELNTRNICLKKSGKKCDGETSPRFFSKKSKLKVSLSTVWNIIQFVFIACPSRGLPEYIGTKLVITDYFT